MDSIIFSLPGNETLTLELAEQAGMVLGEAIFHRFPDGETYIRVVTPVSGKEVVLVATLDRPDAKLLPLFFLARTLRDLGAKRVTLIAPYLAYMRQDKSFNPGEAITSEHFAKLISSFADELITVDPHLHRRRSMSEIYSIPCKVIHASMAISEYIGKNIQGALLVGPDEESEQWISEVAKNAHAPYIILQKERVGDRNVKISFPAVKSHKAATPVLIDDIISTAGTMIETTHRLIKAGMKPPVCIGVHAVFSGNSYQELRDAGACDIITCNTILHNSNRIDLTRILLKAVKCEAE